MDEKMFELFEKMYIEIQEIKSSMTTKEELSNVEQAIKHDILRFENKMDENHKALHDGYKLTYEKLQILESKVNEIDKNVEKQDLEIRVIKGAR